MDEWAKQSEFQKRAGKLSPYDFLVLMTIGQLGMKHPSLAAMVAGITSSITREALHQRFSAAAVSFLLLCLKFALRQSCAHVRVIDMNLLRPFPRVLIVDSTSWDVSPKLAHIFSGSGGNASSANCKLQVFYDYKHGNITSLDLTKGTVPDNRYTDLLPGALEENDLLLFDQGYFKLKTLESIVKNKAFFLTRFRDCTVRDAVSEEAIVLPALLSTTDQTMLEINVILGGTQQGMVTCRLIAVRVDPETAEKRRRQLKKNARRKGRTASRKHLDYCDWILLVTNVSSEQLPSKMVCALYSLRWQIELIFKQMKSVLRIHQSDTANEARLRCELYGKLIAAILIHQIHAEANGCLWRSHRREVSLDKLYKRIQERAFTMFQFLLQSPGRFARYLHQELEKILPSCVKYKQLSRKNTLEMLDAGIDHRLQEVLEEAA